MSKVTTVDFCPPYLWTLHASAKETLALNLSGPLTSFDQNALEATCTVSSRCSLIDWVNSASAPSIAIKKVGQGQGQVCTSLQWPQQSSWGMNRETPMATAASQTTQHPVEQIAYMAWVAKLWNINSCVFDHWILRRFLTLPWILVYQVSSTPGFKFG